MKGWTLDDIDRWLSKEEAWHQQEDERHAPDTENTLQQPGSSSSLES